MSVRTWGIDWQRQQLRNCASDLRSSRGGDLRVAVAEQRQLLVWKVEAVAHRFRLKENSYQNEQLTAIQLRPFFSMYSCIAKAGGSS